MKKLTSTEPSTTELETKVRELLPLPHCNLAFDLFDELLKRRAADYAHGELVRQIRTAKKEAMIEKAIEAKAAPLSKMHLRFWSTYLQEYFDLKGIKAPDIEVIRRVVKKHKSPSGPEAAPVSRSE